MSNGWTGGQYSLYRAVLGIYLFVHFAGLVPWASELFSNDGVLPAPASPLLKLFPNVLAISDAPAAVCGLVLVGAIASIFLLIGFYDRLAAIVIWYILACLFGRNPLIANPALPFIGWLLLAHMFVPSPAYGSWGGRSRTDPRCGWFMPPALFAAAWIVMSLAYSYSGYAKLVSPSWVDGTALTRVLNNPLARPTFVRDLLLGAPATAMQFATWGTLALELLYAPLALFWRVRPWIWTAMVAMHFGLMVLIDFAELSFGMVILHIFTFDPRWVTGRHRGRRDQIFYDGSCGLCHGAVRFVLAEDRTGDAVRFAPLQGQTYAHVIAGGTGDSLPDSIVVRTEAGELLTRSTAVIYVLERLGGMWRVIACVLRVVPGGLRNAGYDLIAGVRHRLFSRPKQMCPLLPPDLRERFQD